MSWIAMLGAATWAAVGNLTGVVEDANTAAPIVGAVVNWPGKGLMATTDANGRFSFAFTTAINSASSWHAVQPHFLPGVGVVISNTKTSYVRVDALDLEGRLVATLNNSILDPGVWAIPTTNLSRGKYICRISSASGTSAFKFVVIGNDRSGPGTSTRLSDAGTLSSARAEAASMVDTLTTTKGGYLPDTLLWTEKAVDSVVILLQDTATSVAAPSARIIVPFDTNWKFNLGDAAGAQATTYSDASWTTLDVPHDWSIAGPFSATAPSSGYGGYLPDGIGWYRKHFTLPSSLSGDRIFVDFDGVMANSTVYINGTSLGTRPSGYTSFRYELTSHVNFGGSDNVIAVRADNSVEPASRWYTGAGIYEQVRLLEVNPVHIDKWATYVSTPTTSSVKVQTTVVNEGATAQSVSIQETLLDPDGAKLPPVTSAAQSVPAGGSASFNLTVPVSNAQLWNLATPKMYTAVTTVLSGSKVLDDESTPFGIRTIEFNPTTGFMLNGQSVKMKGVCLHHDIGGLGSAVPQRAMQRRLAILKSLGVNAIRASHNPRDPLMLDLCDRMGFLVLDEFFDVWTSHKYNMPGDYATYFNQTNPATGTKWYQSDLNDDVMRDRNHPSVVFYSIGNEIHDAIGTRVPLATNMVKICHTLDPNRPVTQALLDPNTAGDYPGASGINPAYPTGSLDILDVFGVNYNYTALAAAIAISPAHAGVSTEMGMNPGLWSSFYMKNPAVVGEFLWTGADYLGESPNGWPTVGSSAGLIDRVGGIKSIGYQYAGVWGGTATAPKTSTAAAVKVLLTVDHPSITTDPNDVAYVKASIVDANGTTVSNAGNAVTFTVTGTAGKIRAFDSGSNRNELFAGPSRNAYNGICYAIVQMKSAGSITITASAAGLAGSSVTVTGVNGTFVPCSGACN
jgi:beta-galactosidase